MFEHMLFLHVAAMDVRKQKDLSGFYKHLLRQQVGEEVLPGEK